ncbi:DUF423 domain-containing protein [Aquabacter spiritensis]|uniref:Uncharacterized membrane protein YgdD (TMEM256/DUF423 family) n=1 Tax=Aquabacter spiritensis TaxID=933073 RepID=A0A4R3M172_9HYPH|nr:DUF423 domain-containing protein [Aquabacter spiritensis]TCT05919.1 uncharacterized membrane protein YgdD (TMEM256/DUF423 family) [Aquabacter spiritensis]
MILWLRILMVAAGLFGASGVAAAAVSAHLVGGASLATAATFLMIHAAALAGLCALALHIGRGRTALLVGASAIAVGTILFSGDLALRALMEIKLLWGTAPTGGSLMIAGWLVAAFGGARLARR